MVVPIPMNDASQAIPNGSAGTKINQTASEDEVSFSFLNADCCTWLQFTQLHPLKSI